MSWPATGDGGLRLDNGARTVLSDAIPERANSIVARKVGKEGFRR